MVSVGNRGKGACCNPCIDIVDIGISFFCIFYFNDSGRETLPQEIPVPNAPFSQLSISISGVSFLFKFYWNESKAFWSMSIYRVDSSPIVEGFAIMTNSCVSASWGYLIQAISPAFGAIFCFNTNNSEDALTRYSFGNTALLVYYTAQEIAQAGSSSD